GCAPASRTGSGRRPGGESVPDALHYAGDLSVPGEGTGMAAGQSHARGSAGRRSDGGDSQGRQSQRRAVSGSTLTAWRDGASDPGMAAAKITAKAPTYATAS